MHLGRKQGEREGTDEDGEEDVHYDTRIGLTAADEGGAEVEGERVGAVDDEEEAGQTGAVSDSGLEVDSLCVIAVHVVDRGEDLLSAKRLSGADGRYDLLSDATTLGDVLEREPRRDVSDGFGRIYANRRTAYTSRQTCS